MIKYIQGVDLIMKHFFSDEQIQKFKEHLINEEKASATIEKYVRDVSFFYKHLKDKNFDKSDVLDYKEYLYKQLKPASVNSILSSLNSFFKFCQWFDCKVKSIKMQREAFRNENKELTKAEYERLLSAARKKPGQRLYYLIQTICSTGIRVSELKFITAESIYSGKTYVYNKGKGRLVLLPRQLCTILKKYIKANKIKTGSVFVTRSGAPLDRSNIWSEMKKLCKSANISAEKVFPHNLRHLFAKTYYTLKKDIVRLADILGHSSVNTTRIYTAQSSEMHRQQLQRLGLVISEQSKKITT